MTLITYTNEAHGFGFVYDDSRFACVDDPDDPRRAAAWSSRIGNEIAASVLLTLAGSTAAEIAAGAVYSILVTTDSIASSTHQLGGWNWEEIRADAAVDFLLETGAAYADVYQMHWRGFPLLQLTAGPSPEVSSPHVLEEIGMLYTPQQTFTSLVVWPTDDREALRSTAREIWDGFFLLPLEREGRVRTGHKPGRSFTISLEKDEERAVES